MAEESTREKAMREGREAVKDGSLCPYRSGQRLMSYWFKGLIEHVTCEDDIPKVLLQQDSRPYRYALGRCMYICSIWPMDRGYEAVSAVFSGWMSQKETGRLPTDMIKAGEDMASDLMDAGIAKSMGGLGGSKAVAQLYDDLPKNMDLIEKYLREEIVSVEAIYIAMRRASTAGVD